MVGGALTRFHLWLGERLGITRYACCWNCRHAHDARTLDHPRPDVCMCDCVDEDCQMAVVNPSEAVWCKSFKAVD